MGAAFRREKVVRRATTGHFRSPWQRNGCGNRPTRAALALASHGIRRRVSHHPCGQGRIRVTLPGLGEGAAALWARLLQFHASAIESKALQRSKAAKERQSGDADIPYRDRERSRAGVEATKAAREAAGDPRLSIEERYPNFTAYYFQVSNAVNNFVAQRFMLPEDAAATTNRMPAREGSQFAELNADSVSELTQTVCLVNGETVEWRLSHNGRNATNDTMQFRAGTQAIASISTSTTVTDVPFS